VRLTSWRRSLGVGEQYNAAIALFYKLRKCRLVPIIRLNLSAERCEINRVADFRWASRSGSGSGLAVALTNNSFLDSFDLLNDSFLDFLDHSLLALGLLVLRGRLLLRRAHWRWGRFLALTELDRHVEIGSRNQIAAALESRGCINLNQGGIGQREGQSWTLERLWNSR
jgi:hypothetical protein